MVNEEMGGFDARYGRFDGLDPAVDGPWLQVSQKGKPLLDWKSWSPNPRSFPSRGWWGLILARK
jgi:hypothetical protein